MLNPSKKIKNIKNLMELIIFLLEFTHIFACCWFGIALLEKYHLKIENTWVDKIELNFDASIL
jgi:hypothetical protein